VPEKTTAALRAALHSFALPFPPPEVTVSLFWHPRMQADPAHRWLRGCVREACAQQLVAASTNGAAD
jgi:DNA-binding transcriptional LysR family regulator